MHHVIPRRLARIVGLAVRTIVGTLFVGTCMASSCWPTPDGTMSNGDAGMMSGPSLELTVDGAHAGPYPLSSYTAALVDSRDQFGQLVASTITLQLAATSGAMSYSWSIEVERYGASLVPFGANPYTIEENSGSTPDRTATLTGQATIAAPGGSLQCGTADCQGLFVIDVIDAAHIEGYFTATMTNPQDGQQSSVVVTFYSPWTTYSP